MIGQDFAHYHLLEKIGEGGMGVIFRAEDTSLQRQVALKFLASHLADTAIERKRFLQEARAAAALDHPNICTVYEAGSHGEQLYIAMAYVQGRTLHDIIAEGPVPLRKAYHLVAQIAAGLAAAHERGIVHRDIKPANIIVGPDQHIRIMDFGLAKLGTGSNLTRTGSTLGTIAYMSPEQMQGDDVDCATDVWALGIVCYELLTGRKPFEGDHEVAMMYSVLNETPPTIRSLRADVPPAIEGLIGRMIERERERRIHNAVEFLAEFKSLLQIDSQPSRSIPSPSAPSREKSIVVLPFANSSSDPENEYFSDGLTEEIISDLSKVGSLRVISRTTAMRLKGTTRSLPEIAGELDVEYALEGGVRKMGANLRITAQLIEVKRDAPLWSDKFNGTLDDIFAMQERVSRGIVDALRIHLTTRESEQLGQHTATNGLAFDVYLRARRDIFSFSKERLDRARQDLERALEVVGDDVLLYRGLGLTEWQYVNAGFSADLSHLDRADVCANKILALDPGGPHGPALKGYINAQRGDRIEWLRQMKRSAEIDPNDPDILVWLSLGWTWSGHPDEAEPLLRHLEARDPHFDYLHFALGTIKFVSGDFKSAIALYRRSSELAPDMVGWPVIVAQAQASLGQITQATATIRDSSPGQANHPLVVLGHLLCHAINGEADGVRAILTDDFANRMWGDFHYAHMVAQSYALIGEVSEGNRWLARAVERGFTHYPYFSEIDPLIANLRGTPAFRETMEKTREEWLTIKSRV